MMYTKIFAIQYFSYPGLSISSAISLFSWVGLELLIFLAIFFFRFPLMFLALFRLRYLWVFIGGVVKG